MTAATLHSAFATGWACRQRLHPVTLLAYVNECALPVIAQRSQAVCLWVLSTAVTLGQHPRKPASRWYASARNLQAAAQAKAWLGRDCKAHGAAMKLDALYCRYRGASCKVEAA